MFRSYRIAPLPRARTLAGALGASALLALAFACSSGTGAKEEKLCAPGAYVFCRCKDRTEGSKLCNDDSVSFGPCEPCESLGLGEDPDPGPIPDDFDANAPPDKCGDGIAQDREDCDDKNAVENDGCTKDCKLTPALPGTTAAAKSANCPGLDVHVWGGTHKPTTTGSTTTAAGAHTTTPNCTTTAYPTAGGLGNDRIFKVVAHKTGQMTVRTSDTNYDNVLYVSTTCPTVDAGNVPVPQFACENEVDGVGGETMQFPVTDGMTYYVFVDGAGINIPNGNFRVTFEIP